MPAPLLVGQSAPAVASVQQPSLRRRLLWSLLGSMLLTVVVASAAAYVLALRYSNQVHDRDLTEDVRSVAIMLQAATPNGSVLSRAKFLLEHDAGGASFYAINSRRHGLIGGSARFVPPPPTSLGIDESRLYDARIGSLPVRAVSMAVASTSEMGDVLTVTLAEDLKDRQKNAGEILLLIVLIQLLLIAVLLAVVWHGVGYGLRLLDPLAMRLADRGEDLRSVTDANVPTEILPLTRTIDELFTRLRGLMELHERFISDAAHQLRTPLAGLVLHAERAARTHDAGDRATSLAYVQELATRVARTSSQLLALTLAEAPLVDNEALSVADLSSLIPELLATQVQQALDSGVDLGFDAADGPLPIAGHPVSLQELLSNLVDNAITYAGRGGTVTVSLGTTSTGEVCLCVDDDGPGVPLETRARLGERFYRAPGAVLGGTGLGLAIVERIARRHGAQVRYAASELGGLRVEVQFPHGSRD